MLFVVIFSILFFIGLPLLLIDLSMKQAAEKIDLRIAQIDADGTLQLKLEQRFTKPEKVKKKKETVQIEKKEASVTAPSVTEEESLKHSFTALMNRQRQQAAELKTETRAPASEAEADQPSFFAFIQSIPTKIRKKFPGYIYPSKDLLLKDEEDRMVALERKKSKNQQTVDEQNISIPAPLKK